MKVTHLCSLVTIITGVILFLIGAINGIMWIGLSGFLACIAGLIILLFTTATGITVLIASGIIIIFAILAFFGPVRLTYEIKDLMKYYDNKDSIVEISAIVTNIEESIDGDGGTDCRAYVSYSYDNKSYNNVYWRIVGSDFRENSEVKIKIASQDPGRIFKSGMHHYTSLIFPIVITLFLLAAIINLPIVMYKEYKARKRNNVSQNI